MSFLTYGENRARRDADVNEDMAHIGAPDEISPRSVTVLSWNRSNLQLQPGRQQPSCAQRITKGYVVRFSAIALQPCKHPQRLANLRLTNQHPSDSPVYTSPRA